jgi:hypothetical protein
VRKGGSAWPEMNAKILNNLDIDHNGEIDHIDNDNFDKIYNGLYSTINNDNMVVGSTYLITYSIVGPSVEPTIRKINKFIGLFTVLEISSAEYNGNFSGFKKTESTYKFSTDAETNTKEIRYPLRQSLDWNNQSTINLKVIKQIDL